MKAGDPVPVTLPPSSVHQMKFDEIIIVLQLGV